MTEPRRGTSLLNRLIKILFHPTVIAAIIAGACGIAAGYAGKGVVDPVIPLTGDLSACEANLVTATKKISSLEGELAELKKTSTDRQDRINGLEGWIKQVLQLDDKTFVPAWEEYQRSKK
jgi:hypothetical protein